MRRRLPGGESAIAIVRLTGNGATAIADRFLKARGTISEIRPREMTLGQLVVDGGAIDEVVIVRFEEGSSYTGEEMIEIHSHGNPLIVQKVVAAAREFGARTAEPGEFTRRAFLNGRIDLTQAEAVAELIQGESQGALKAAARQLGGEMRTRLGELRGRIVDLLARLELELDFVEEGYALADDDDIQKALSELQSFVETLLGSWRSIDVVRKGPRVLLAGRPNSGKSSLFNAFLGYGRAIVSETAGTTRDYLEERVLLGDDMIRLIDTAGICGGADPVEAVGVGMSRELISAADVILFLIDMSGDEDRGLVAQVLRDVRDRAGDTPLLLVGTKADRLEVAADREYDLEVSIYDRDSIERLGAAVVSLRQGSGEDVTAMVSARQADELKRISGLVEVILTEYGFLREESELLSSRLRELLGPLSALTGDVTNEQVLDAVFSRFCIGK